MANNEQLTYESEQSVNKYYEFNMVFQSFLHGMVLDYFGDKLKGAKVVDFGCGGGALLGQCHEKGASNVLGIDLNETMIKWGPKSGDKR